MIGVADFVVAAVEAAKKLFAVHHELHPTVSGFGFSGLGFRVQGLGFRVQGLGGRAQAVG